MNAQKVTLVSVAIAFFAACGGAGAMGSGGACLSNNDEGELTHCMAYVGAEFERNAVTMLCSGQMADTCPATDSRLGVCKYNVGESDEFHQSFYDASEDAEQSRASFKHICETGEGVWSE